MRLAGEKWLGKRMDAGDFACNAGLAPLLRNRPNGFEDELRYVDFTGRSFPAHW